MKHIILTLAILLVFSCKNSSSSESNVDIEWKGGQTITYSYSGGVPSGGTWYNKFEVISGSGNVYLKIAVNGSNKATETITAQEGLTYKVKVVVSFGNCSNSNSSTVELSSTSATNSRKLKVDCASVGIGSASVSETTD